MQIDSSLSGYQHQGRLRDLDKTTAEALAQEPPTIKRPSGNATISSTLLSSSLANSLWAVGGARAPVDQDAAAPVSAEEKIAAQAEWVRGAYSEYGEAE
jgi:hypothetical protein